MTIQSDVLMDERDDFDGEVGTPDLIRLYLDEIGKAPLLDAATALGTYATASTISSRGARLRSLPNRAIATRLAVLIGLVGDVRRGGDVPDGAAS